ncbi:MAG: two component transcriptional regulator, LuxR family [Deltaproteobacteria bacterium]|nr:two component transcriptional regulator, LuxR family [Deltaproteobacteria bacterium]
MDCSEVMVRESHQGEKASAIRSAWETLTQWEREILKLVAEGYSNREIADLLCISVKTVEKHRANPMKKLDLHDAASLIALAAEKGLIKR